MKNAKIRQSQLGTQEYQTVEHYLHGSIKENHLIFLVPMSPTQNTSKDFKVWLGESYHHSYREQKAHFMANLKPFYQYFMKHPKSNIFQEVLSNNRQQQDALILVPVDSPQKMFYAHFQNILWIIGVFWLMTSVCIALIELTIIFKPKNPFRQTISPSNY